MKSRDAANLVRNYNRARIHDEIQSKSERAAAKVNVEFAEPCFFCNGKGINLNVIRAGDLPELEIDFCCFDARKEAESRWVELMQENKI